MHTKFHQILIAWLDELMLPKFVGLHHGAQATTLQQHHPIDATAEVLPESPSYHLQQEHHLRHKTQESHLHVYGLGLDHHYLLVVALNRAVRLASERSAHGVSDSQNLLVAQEINFRTTLAGMLAEFRQYDAMPKALPLDLVAFAQATLVESKTVRKHLQ